MLRHAILRTDDLQPISKRIFLQICTFYNFDEDSVAVVCCGFSPCGFPTLFLGFPSQKSCRKPYYHGLASPKIKSKSKSKSKSRTRAHTFILNNYMYFPRHPMRILMYIVCLRFSIRSLFVYSGMQHHHLLFCMENDASFYCGG